MSIFDLQKNDTADFEKLALELFHYQADNVDVYKRYLKNLDIDYAKIDSLGDIPFLPVEFFKSTDVYCSDVAPEVVFTSSSTTNTGVSRHIVADIELYKSALKNSFEYFYGNAANYCYLFLLPSYLERKGSSLIFMARELIKTSRYEGGGFYLNNFQSLYNQLIENEKSKIPTILFGVTFALLDFAERYKMMLKSTTIMETGGMKGRREEITREQVHNTLCNSFGINRIAGEYGMTEMLSQAYSVGNGVFETPPWVKIELYNIYNPLRASNTGTGGINVIDLANRHSCAFIQTSDIGKMHSNNMFEIIGRIDNSDIRGCNLMVL